MTDYFRLEKELVVFLKKQDPMELDEIFNATAKMLREYQHLTNEPIKYMEDKNNENR